MFILLATSGFVLAKTTKDSVVLDGLPGVTVAASVINTDPSVVDLPSPIQPGWQALSQPLGQGFGEQVYWVRLVIDVPSQLLTVPMVLRFHPPNARDVKFFLPDGSSMALGTQAPFDQRMLGFPDLAASFVPLESPTVVTVRLATAGRMFGSFELMSERTYYQSQAWRTALHGIFYGMLLLAVLVNVVNWATTRQSIYGLYVGFVGFSLLASLAVNGYLHALVLGAWPEYHSTIQLWAFAGMAATAIAFAARMLQLRTWHLRLETVADLMAVMLMLLVVLASVWVAWRPYVWEVVLAAFFVYGMGSLAASIRNLRQQRSLQNILLALAFLIFAVSQWVSMGTVFGFVPATPVNTGMWQIGLVIHLVFLQMALVINSRQSRWRNWQQQARLDALKVQADTEARRSRDLQLFLERLTHEFKTPLAVIDSSVQSLGMLEKEKNTERELRYGRIRRAVARLNDLLMRSLVAEKTTLTEPQAKRQLLELPALLEAVLSEFTSNEFKCDRDCILRLDYQSHAGRSGQLRLRLRWNEIKRPDLLWIDAQASWLDAAFYHIFDNAVKYSEGDEGIVVRIEQRESASGPRVVVTISNGCDEAIVESDLLKLFEKYYRKGEHGNVPGAGIGLYVAKQAIEAHGGNLTAYLLEPGQIQFQIELPLVIRDPQLR
ncbi:MAG: sensor histidine kinase [Burkholderiaceae bacterium]|nr:sensor histidine kinase [Burkholderiaceae bacterium]MCD8537045.1 sensor histidine kinase [Burkholderiaceae bacterium]